MTSVTDRRAWTVDECLLRLGSLPSRVSKLSMSGEFETRQRSPHNRSEAGRSVTTLEVTANQRPGWPPSWSGIVKISIKPQRVRRQPN